MIMLFLVVLGGAAVLEVHRALHHGGNGDVKALRERESALRKQLQVISRQTEQHNVADARLPLPRLSVAVEHCRPPLRSCRSFRGFFTGPGGGLDPITAVIGCKHGF